MAFRRMLHTLERFQPNRPNETDYEIHNCHTGRRDTSCRCTHDKLLFWAIAFHGRPSRQASQPVDQSNFPAHRTIRMRTLTGETNKPEGQVMNNRSLKGKSVLIGGGAKNLGGLISRTFANDGARVCVHYNSASSKADADKTIAE